MGNTLAAKLFMSMVARGKKLMQKGMDPNNAALASGTPIHRAQLNEAEWAGPLLATLLFLHSKGVACPLGSTLAVAGQATYFWGQFVFGKWAMPMGAMPRYAATVL